MGPESLQDGKVAATESAKRSNYGQILRSSSIIGGAQGINYVISLVRTKVVAVLLGPSGVGLVGLYLTTVGMVETLAGLGIRSSGVREIAEADSSGHPESLAKTLKTLRRACWLTGVLGWVLTAALAYPLSVWVFDSPKYAMALAILGCTLVFSSISGGQMALIQGMRRIGDLARLNLLGVTAGTIVALPIYYWLGEQGIVPVLVLSAFLNLVFSWWFARRIQVVPVQQSFGETVTRMKSLLSLGVAFMWSAFLGAIVALVIRAIIQRELGLEANGLYQAAWAISGMFAGFILGAMGADFYPTLTAAKGDKALMARLVNEQTEVGILLALPGLVATLAFAPLIMTLLYSREFLGAADLLPWFILGVFGRVVSWPIGFIMLALGEGGWFAMSETVAVVIHAVLAFVLIGFLGLWGVALAFAVLYLFVTALVSFIAFRLIRFHWSLPVLRMLFESSLFIGAAFLFAQMTQGVQGLPAAFVGMFLTLAAALYSVRGLARRLGDSHRLVAMACQVPLGRVLCGLPLNSRQV
jgi:PST family polysaccharide transporter